MCVVFRKFWNEPKISPPTQNHALDFWYGKNKVRGLRVGGYMVILFWLIPKFPKKTPRTFVKSFCKWLLKKFIQYNSYIIIHTVYCITYDEKFALDQWAPCVGYSTIPGGRYNSISPRKTSANWRKFEKSDTILHSRGSRLDQSYEIL